LVSGWFYRLFPGVDEEQTDSDEEVEVRDIGDIGPDIAAPAVWPRDPEWELDVWEGVDEVSDASEDDAIVEISDASGDDEPESCVGDPVSWLGPFDEEHHGDDHGDEGEDHKEPSLSCPDSENGAGVEDECEIEDARDRNNRLVIGDEVSEVWFSEYF